MQNNFYIRKIIPESAESVIKDVGFDESYIKPVLPKYSFILLKINNLSAPQANIIKQLALSIGADAAVHRNVITCKVDKSDVLLGCTHAELKTLCDKLKSQPFKLYELAPLLHEQIDHIPLPSVKIRDIIINWSKKTYIMGILNITPDSFSDGGKYLAPDNAINQFNSLVENGSDIIDIGGESTRPSAEAISVDEEIKRIIPVINKIREFNLKTIISVDTRNSATAREAVKAGADIINDVSGFDHDPEMLKTVAELQVPVIIMHSLSDPKTMQLNPEYPENVVDYIYKSLSDKVKLALDAGIQRENIIIDPGIGFGKTLEHNIEIIKRINEFTSLKQPLLAGVSRKSVISKILEVPPNEREEANIALNAYLAANGVNIIRVHDVEKHTKAFKVLDKLVK